MGRTEADEWAEQSVSGCRPHLIHRSCGQSLRGQLRLERTEGAVHLLLALDHQTVGVNHRDVLNAYEAQHLTDVAGREVDVATRARAA